MKKYLSLFGWLFIALAQLSGQEHDKIWKSGGTESFDPNDKFGLLTLNFEAFSKFTFSTEDVGDIFFTSCGITMSDSMGNLQFYSNGQTIYTSDNEIMSNGSEMFPTQPPLWSEYIPFPQQTLALPITTQSGKYLYLNVGGKEINDTIIVVPGYRCFSSIIDMNENNGKGKVVSKLNMIVNDFLEGTSISATKHANGRDWWVLIPEWGNGRFYELLTNGTSVRIVDTLKTDRIFHYDTNYSTFSPDGTKFCYISGWKELQKTYQAHLFIWDFDRCTGALSNMQDTIFIYPPNSAFQSVAISPNSKYLYAACFNKLFQFDLKQNDIIGSAILIDTYDGFLAGTAGYDYDSTYFANSQLAPDGRIYISSTGTLYMHRIDFPNKPGKDCQFVQHGIKFPVFNFGTVPNNPHYRLGPVDGSACDSLGYNNHPLAGFKWQNTDISDYRKIEFTDNSFYEPATWAWNFAGLGVSSDTNPVFTFPTDGVYKVCLKVCNQYACDSVCHLVTIGVSTTATPNALEALSIYPNPASGKVLISLLTQRDAFNQTITFSNPLGQILLSQTLNGGQATIDVSKLPQGLVYVQVIENGKVKAVRKLVISR